MAISADCSRRSAREWGLENLQADLEVIRDLQPALEAGRYRVTVAIHDGRDITAVWPGLHDRSFGVAIDVGSTTIAGHLADLADGAVLASDGVMNPQIRFGEDLMSRVSYAMLHDGGAAEMTRAVRDALGSLVTGLASQAGVPVTDILEVTLVGNPIMHHLLLGIDPIPLGSAPFALATDLAVRTRARELELPVHPGARAYLLPCIAGHVGADAAGAILVPDAVPRGRDHAPRGRRDERRDRARQPASGCSPRPRRPGPPSRAPRSAAASERRRARSSASASTR